MSQYYSGKRVKNIYSPENEGPFKLSRSKIDLFLSCPQCFYIDRKLGVGTPPGFPFNLNSAVDHLLKKEFDIYREKKERHPIIEKYNVDAIPAKREELDEWRENFKGVQYHHHDTNFIITGAIDDLWISSKNEYIVVDYKATSKGERITSLDKEWHNSYKRQMDIYQWLLRKNNLTVSNTGYFLYCNGDTSKKMFNGKIEFDITLIPYKGSDSWIEKTLLDIKKTLEEDNLPKASPDCDFCKYRQEVKKVLNNKEQGNLFS